MEKSLLARKLKGNFVSFTEKPARDEEPIAAAVTAYFTALNGGNVLDHILVVEEIRANEVMVVYAYGTAPLWNIYQAQAVRLKGKFVDSDLVVELPRSQATATYHLKNNGTITATRETTHGGGHAQATMRRVE